jgi:hypothetical protein
MAEAAVMLEGNEVFEIGSEAANDECGHDKTRVPKRPGCGSVGEGKGHS